MADDITLTVRVRDLTRGDFARLQGNLNRMRQNLQGVDRSTASAGRNSRFLGRDLAQLTTALRRMQITGRATTRELTSMNNALSTAARTARNAARASELSRSSYRAIARDIRTMRAELILLGRQGTVLDRLGARLTLLQRRMREASNNSSGFRRTFSRMGEGLVGGLRGGVLATGLLVAWMRRLGSHINLNRRWVQILIATLVLLGPAAQALGALLITVLGGAFIALGAFALRGNAQVKSAFQDMKRTLGSVVREAALPLRDSLVATMQEVGVAARQMQPALTAAFGATAPLVKDFVGAFTDLAGMSMPGIVEALEQSRPAMEGFREAMAQVGKGFGDMFAAMTAGGGAEALGQVWVTVGRELANLLVGIGEFINMATQSGTATMMLVGVFRTLSGVLNVVEMGLGTIDLMFGDLFNHINAGVMGFDSLAGGVADVGTAFVASGQSVGDLKKKLKDVNKEIKEMEKDRDWADDMWMDKASKDRMLADSGASDQAYAQAKAKRKSLLEAIKTAEEEAATATLKHAASVADLVAKITSLNDLNRSNLDARSAQEQAIDDATKGASKYSNALKMVKGQLDLNGESGRKAYELLSKIASTTKESTDAAVKANAPWEQVRSQWQRGYDQVVKLADGMGLSKEQAQALATQIVGIPDKEIFVKAVIESAISGLNSVKAAYLATPGEKTVNVKTLTAEAIARLEAVGFKVERLPDGSFNVIAHTSDARSNITAVDLALSALNGRVATTYVKTVRQSITQVVPSKHDRDGNGVPDMIQANARGGIIRRAFGGPIRGYPTGGGVSGPGTETSDSILARLSNGEFVVRAAMVRRYGQDFFEALNSGRIPKFAKGGGVKSEAKQAIKPIKAAMSGDAEKTLVRLMNSIVKGSIKMATALKQVTSALDKAKNKLSSLKSSSSALSSGVKSGVVSAGDITSGVESGKAVTVQALMSRMTASKDKAKAFASALKALRKKGLSKGLLKQIAEAGIEGGGLETAGALLTASGSELKSFNSLGAQISAAGSSAGKTTADAMYAAQIKSQEKLVKSLDELAKALKKATKKKATGGIVGAASGGARGGLVKVGEEGEELVRLPYGSSVYSNADSRRIAGSMGGSGGGIFIIPISIGGKVLDEVILDSNRRTVRTRGGNVQAVFGPTRR